MRHRDGALRLLPLSGVDVDEGGFTATTGEPWLELQGIDLSRLAGRLVEIGYRASLIDQPTRPLIRFFLQDGTRLDRIAAAPFAGAGLWTGRVPRGTRRLAVSPAGRPGRFGFRIEGVRARSWPHLLLEGLRRRPSQTRSALLTKLIGWMPESDSNLAWAIGAFDLSGYAEWARSRLRPPEPDHLDRPRAAEGAMPPIVLLMEPGADAADSFASLRGQIDAGWRLLALDMPGGSADARILPMDRRQACEVLAALPRGSLVGRISAGDTLPPHALAFVREQSRREPTIQLFYGDEIVDDRLVLKPGWSPRLMAALSLLGGGAFALADGWTEEERRGFVDCGALPVRLRADAKRIRALRRVILHARTPAAAAIAPSGARMSRQAPPLPRAAIIIPTCDQPALLGRIVASVRERSAPESYRLVIVDNGRADGPGRTLLADLAGAGDATVLRREDAFNFSGFCNDAAATCEERLLVFLNDDTEILSEGWLERLGALAFEPDVGAVGAKLTYPDGRLQHIGVLVGMGGSAGHIGAMAAGDDPGWLGRDTVPHEVSAVTGACLAVEREKFVAVGGFDAEALPIELSDVDLCLKLNARGWQTLVDPGVHLMHEESASRGGATFRRLTKYSRQRDIFVERWRHVLRDDPFFHPGLSLYSTSVALG